MGLLQSESKIACPAISTLLWDGDDIVDVTSGIRIRSDGSLVPRSVGSAYPFDRAVGVRHDNAFWAVEYANRGTKGLLLKNGTVHREVNRSYYFAHAYDYPVAIAIGPANRVVVIHCPNEFNIIEVEDADTGTLLATIKTPNMEFHSRLAVSSNEDTSLTLVGFGIHLGELGFAILPRCWVHRMRP